MWICLIQYDECIKDCDKAVEKVYEEDGKKVSRDWTCDWVLYKALTEYRNLNTLKMLNEAENVKKELAQEE